MTVGARLRSKVAGGLPRRGPRGRGRRQGDEEASAILEHLELDDEVAAEGAAGAGRPGARSARRVHLAVLPERYEPLEEPVSGDKPKKKYRQKLKKYGKVGPALSWGAGVRGARSRASQLSRWGAGGRSPPGDCAQLLWAPPVSPSAPHNHPLSSIHY